MTKTKITSIGILFFFSFSLFVSAQEENLFNVKWDNGFKIESADKNFKLKFGGRIMWDNAFFFQDDDLEEAFGELNNGSEFRRARLFHSGTVYKNMNYKIQLDFAGGKVVFKDVYMGLKGIPTIGNFRVGHFKEPFRLNALTSSKYITFMERGLPINMQPERNTGMMFYNDFNDKRVSWQAGLFRRSDKAGNDKEANDGYALTTRLTGLPILNKEENKLLHLGIGYSYRKPESKEYKVSARPEAHLGNKYVTTGSIENVSSINLMNIESAFVLDSFSLQGEYLMSNVKTNDSSLDDYSFNSYYAQASYFLTGESRKYKNSLSGFGRVKPKNNFGSENGYGALEVALRYSSIDLNNEDVVGGELSDVTLGMNWYLNPVSRVMLNYVLADVSEVGNANIFQVRFQIDF